MTEEEDDADESSEEHGVTDEDMERITAFLEKAHYERSVDDLRPASEE